MFYAGYKQILLMKTADVKGTKRSYHKKIDSTSSKNFSAPVNFLYKINE